MSFDPSDLINLLALVSRELRAWMKLWRKRP